jgi:uncharacterized membrane protein YfcA
MDQAIGMLVVGLAAGVLSGMFGIGGGVVIVPILVTFFGFALTEAVGTSLAALLMPVGIFAAIAYYRAGKLNIGIALWVALGLAVGATISAQIALGLDKALIQKAYALFLIFAGWRFAEPRKWWAEYRAETPPPAVPEREPRTSAWYVLLALGFAAGILSGMFGVGGGIVIVPALVGLLWFDQKLASGTSLGALLLPVGLGAAVSYYQAGQLDIGPAALVAAGLTVGALVGARIALGLPSKTVKRMYGVFLLIVALRFLFF